jgi:hypothetical protein
MNLFKSAMSSNWEGREGLALCVGGGQHKFKRPRAHLSEVDRPSDNSHGDEEALEYRNDINGIKRLQSPCQPVNLREDEEYHSKNNQPSHWFVELVVAVDTLLEHFRDTLGAQYALCAQAATQGRAALERKREGG